VCARKRRQISFQVRPTTSAVQACVEATQEEIGMRLEVYNVYKM